MSQNVEVSGNAAGGMGLGTVLTIVFVVLKLCHVIDWSWWWVFSPLLISAALGALVLLLIGILLLVAWKYGK